MTDSEFISYFFVGLIICILVVIQVRVFNKTFSLIRKISVIFPSLEYMSIQQVVISLPENTEEKRLVTQLVLNPDIKVAPEFRKIVDSINNYLTKNKGAVSDFMLIKDIVERNCDAIEDEVATQTPIPLYLGLMGTMFGILLGLGKIALFGGGFSSFIDNPQQSIGELMGGVALAMIASLCGIILSTWGAWKAKESKSILEAEKNQFYSWIQAELLPVLSGNMTNTLQLLQHNFSSFNDSFASNICRMEKALHDMTGSFDDQLSILEYLKQLDVKKMATANVTVLKQLECSTNSFKEFAAYLSQTTEYLNAVRSLNQTVGEYLSNTSALTHLANYFEEEKSYFDERKAQLNRGVVQFDDILRQSFDSLQNTAQTNLNTFSQFINETNNKLNNYIDQSEDGMKDKMIEFSDVLSKHLNEQMQLFEAKCGQLSAVADAVNDFTSIKKELSQLVETLENKDGNDESYLVVSSVDKLGAKLDTLCKLVKSNRGGAQQASLPFKEYEDAEDLQNSGEKQPGLFDKLYVKIALGVFAAVLFLASLGVIFITGNMIVALSSK